MFVQGAQKACSIALHGPFNMIGLENQLLFTSWGRTPNSPSLVNGRTSRPESVLSFLVGEGFQEHKIAFSTEMMRAAEAMRDDKDNGRYHTEDFLEQERRIFGRVQPSTLKKNSDTKKTKKKKNQTQRRRKNENHALTFSKRL